MGQGAQQALAMMAAEEMDADWSMVRFKEAPALDAYANGYPARVLAGDSVPGPLSRAFDYSTYRLVRWFGLQPTGGSMSVRTTGAFGMTVAGAAAREMLVAAAAERFGVSATELTVNRSTDQPRRQQSDGNVRRAGVSRGQAVSPFTPDAEER